MVFGLAWRCRSSLSVKKPCKTGASWLRPFPGGERLLQAARGQREQLGDRLQVPVG